MSSGDLTIAVPRGALFTETLDWLERLGVGTGEVRTNDRKLLFADVGLITMRPSDVPIYVAAGAAGRSNGRPGGRRWPAPTWRPRRCGALV